MAYSQRKPPITIELTVDAFNALMETITKEEEQYFKHKLLLYSNLDKENDKIIFGLFPREVKDLIVILVHNLKDRPLSLDYVSVMQKIKNKIEEVNFNSE